MFLSNVGNKTFCFFKKWVSPFLDKGTFQEGGVKFSKILRGGGGGGRLVDVDFFLGGGGGGCLSKKR